MTFLEIIGFFCMLVVAMILTGTFFFACKVQNFDSGFTVIEWIVTAALGMVAVVSWVFLIGLLP